jgi:hypothetical protein
MSEKYYVVSESELVALHIYICDNETADEVYTACRARPVPEWATKFTNADYSMPKELERWEDIKR